MPDELRLLPAKLMDRSSKGEEKRKEARLGQRRGKEIIHHRRNGSHGWPSTVRRQAGHHPG